MCGLTGFYRIRGNSTPQKDRAIGQAMESAITHRGPDAGAVWQDDTLPLTLAHRRLAILDLSPQGAQPMASSSGRYVVAYNGEIYNFQDLRSQLEAAGAKFRGRSDTEVFLEALEFWGLPLTLQKIIGMFAIVLWDKKTRTLHFIRDRLGKKPLYVGWAGTGALVFGSELKALRAHPDFVPAMSQDALALYMRFGYVCAPHCIYKNIWSLLPGHWLSLEVESLETGGDLSTQMKPYWALTRTAQEAQEHPLSFETDEQATDAFEALLKTCTRERMVSDVPLGAFLSGGIDSSSVVAIMQSLSAKKVKTYTIGFEEAGFNEAEYASKVAAHLGTDHHEFMLSAGEAREVIPKLPDLYDEPFADISAIPTYLVSAFARKSVTVALSGDGGDEMLGGYNRHIHGPRLWNKMKLIPPKLRGILGKAILGMPQARLDALLPFLPQAGGRLHKAAESLSLETQEALYMRWLSRFERPPDILVAGVDEPVIPLSSAPASFDFASRMMAGDALSYLPNDILVKVDRASMGVSLECRAPLLDSRIFEFVWRLPLQYKIRGGQGKFLLRQVLARHVPNHLFERPKQGFAIPVAEWLRGPLREWAEDLLTDDDVLKPEMIKNLWAAHLEGRGNHAEKLWSILMLKSWQRRWM